MTRREEGFTLVEVLVGALILVVGILSTLSVLDSSRRLTVVAEHQTTLAQRAQNELERVLSLPYSQVALTGTSTSWSTSPGSYTYVNSNRVQVVAVPVREAGQHPPTSPTIVRAARQPPSRW